ncbi:alternative ribosome rescue aminoacyl-tRNA hydrolase ArfB [Maribacter sp. CXY002]|uniref:alternative ribosome rescue aminoacyl-tRNA hydrolase ArfB n=1 Tax=Maribacter luteocoastalis TaxID=3407671 RepID=UPI003B66B83E
MEKEIILAELQFKAIRSSGPGGQHANKVSSKVELSYNLSDSAGLTEKEKSRLLLKLKSKLSNTGQLQLQCDESRSQHKNKELAIDRFFKLLENALKVPKKRKRTKPTKSSIEKRLTSKKRTALKKAHRGKPEI